MENNLDKILNEKKIAVFIVSYNAEKYLESVINRIPDSVKKGLAEIFIIDDSSTDNTYYVGLTVKNKYPEYNINIYRTPYNRGYGGNQKLGYLYCIKKNYDYVILLHGDGQYAPEYLPQIISEFESGCDCVFASRMLNKKDALKGGMPKYKWIGNQILTFIENSLLGTDYSEFHTGFRAYSVDWLKKIPFIYNSDGFHFDTEIIIQGVETNWTVNEIPIPTYYGDEICHVNGIKYAYNCIRSIIKNKLCKVGLYYEKNYDFNLFETDSLYLKKSPVSMHQFVLNKSGLNSNDITADISSSGNEFNKIIASKVKNHYRLIAKGIEAKHETEEYRIAEIDYNSNFSENFKKISFTKCYVLDIFEHIEKPENFLKEIFKIMKPESKLFVSSGNIGYLPMRISLLLGQFNYGKKGILDMTHKRLYNISSMKKILEFHGFRVDRIIGFAPPLSDMVNPKLKIFEHIHNYFSKSWPGLFAYNFIIQATRIDDIDEIFEKTF